MIVTLHGLKVDEFTIKTDDGRYVCLLNQLPGKINDALYLNVINHKWILCNVDTHYSDRQR